MEKWRRAGGGGGAGAFLPEEEDATAGDVGVSGSAGVFARFDDSCLSDAGAPVWKIHDRAYGSGGGRGGRGGRGGGGGGGGAYATYAVLTGETCPCTRRDFFKLRA